MKFNEQISSKRLKKMLNYNPHTGIFTWKVSSGTKKKGDIGGYETVRGYITISIDGVAYKAHRLAWFYMHSKWPSFDIDHKNSIGCDNRISNLRTASRTMNCANGHIRRTNKSGYKGIGFCLHLGLYRAKLQHRMSSIHLGYFKTAKEAHEAYKIGAKKYFGEFARIA